MTPTPRLERDPGAAFAAGGGGMWDSGSLGPPYFPAVSRYLHLSALHKRDPPMDWVAREGSFTWNAR